MAKALASVCVFVVLATIISSCSTYENVTGYFNTYYNAGKLFDDAVAEVEKVPQPARDSNYFAPPVVPAATNQKFDKVIEKCSKLIQFYPQSSWVEGAILMIGKSYVYQGDYEPAFRKFRELIKNFPSGDERFEAKLWFAMGLYGAKNQGEALALTKELFSEARAEGKDDIMLDALMLEAQIYVDRREYDQAAVTYALAVEVSGDGAKRAWSQYQLGLCYEKLAEYAKAADAYIRVQEYSASFSLQFRSKLKHAMMLSEIGLYTEAIAALEELIGDQLKPEEYALADLEIANAYWALGDSAEAFSLYAFIDTTYKRTDASAKGLYRRGLIFEKHYADFQKALTFYAKAKSENLLSEITPLAQRKAENFTNYFLTTKALRNYDSLLARSLLPDTALSRIDSLSRAADTLKPKAALPDEEPVAADQEDAEQRGAGKDAGGDAPEPAGVVPAPPPSAPPVNRERDTPPQKRFAAGKDDMKSRRAHLNDTEDFDDELRPSKKFAAAKDDSTKKPLKAALPAGPTKLTPDSLRALVSKTCVELASLFFLEMGYPDSALFYYKRMITENPSSRLVPKALYAMAEVYRTLADTAEVDSIYRRILREHGTSEYAQKVQEVLGLEVTAAPVDPVELRYARAESLLVAGNSAAALRAYKQIAKSPASSLTPKAIYTVGWVYENVLGDLDSADAWYRTLLEEYPATAYAHEAGPKIAVKDDSSSISKYVKYKKIEPIVKPSKPNFGKRPVAVDRVRRPDEVGEGDDQEIDNTDEDADPDEEEPEQEEPEPEDPDDGGQL